MFQRGQQVTLVVHDWRILIHFASFCFWMTIAIMIDGRVKRNCKFGFKLQVHMLLRSAIIIVSLSKYNDHVYVDKGILFLLNDWKAQSNNIPNISV